MDEDKIITKLLEHDERLERIEENMFTKEDSRKMMELLEGIATVCKNIQEDHVFAIEWIKRLQTKIDQQENEIHAIKARLQMA